MVGTLTGKIAVVTGAATGLGREIALRFAQQGAQVAILGRTLSTLEKTAAEIGKQTLPIVCDISQSDQVRAAFAKVTQVFGGVDILINNAAIYTPFRLEDASDDELQSTFATNVIGAAFCIRSAIPLMRHRGNGDIVNITSESVRNPFPYLSVYASSKAALESLTQGLRTELREDKIRVSALRVGAMTGNESAAKWAPGMLDKFIAAIQASGHAAAVGAGMSPKTVADYLVRVLDLPREANVDLIELRGV
ncbi:SDR family oxidoreductase [Herminiimonas arsenitoxidans]|uniref:SDR family oxidoreductase n=1 Tax=Herminiimonas arsenitoxidans TaxID=1809410 RepID=UPI0009711E5D|nr:SDR family oxidoreductase [Herminiimonas arsenitoxidans]